MPFCVFVSHDARDHDDALRIVGALESAGIPCWVAPRDVPPGVAWSAATVRALHEVRLLLLVLTGAGNESPRTLREVERAVALRVPLLTLRRAEVELTPGMEYFISVAHWLDAAGRPLPDVLTELVARVRAALEVGEARQDLRAVVGDGTGGGHNPSAHTSRLEAPSSSPPSNLPPRLPGFVGREREAAALRDLLSGGGGRQRGAAARLVTVTGMGGMGKTRLAQEVAHGLLRGQPPAFPDGVFWVDLTPLADPALVSRTVARALSVPESGGHPAEQALAAALARRRVLLLLDNCEHVLPAAARLAATLIRECEGVHVLATSRERLGVSGEVVQSLTPLATTASGGDAGDAVRLFEQRARAVEEGFALTAQNAADVASICRRLDGIPLAIELAAARVRVLSPGQIARRLDERFRLLTGGSRDLPPHQQTLRSLIDWSYDLLGETEKRLLGRLAVFAGGWTLEAAEAVCAGEELDPWDVMDALVSLVDKSLVVFDAAAEEQGGRRRRQGEGRYRLLETVRAYAAERLEASPGEAATTRGRHRAYYGDLARRAGEGAAGPDGPGVLDALEREHDNLRAALDGCFAADPPDGDAALAICHGLSIFWKIRAHYREGVTRMTRALEATAGRGDTEERAYVANGAALCALYLGDTAGANRLMEESVAMRRRIGRPDYLADGLFNLGAVLGESGDLAGAERALEEGLPYSDPDSRTRMGIVGNLGICRFLRGDHAGAEPLLREALALNRRKGVRQGEAIQLLYLGAVARATGDGTAAGRDYAESLRVFRAIGHRRGVCLALSRLAELAEDAGDPARAARLVGAHDALMEATGSALENHDRERHDALRERLRRQSAPDFGREYAAGRRLSEDEAAAFALGEAAAA